MQLPKYPKESAKYIRKPTVPSYLYKEISLSKSILLNGTYARYVANPVKNIQVIADICLLINRNVVIPIIRAETKNNI